MKRGNKLNSVLFIWSFSVCSTFSVNTENDGAKLMYQWKGMVLYILLMLGLLSQILDSCSFHNESYYIFTFV